MYESVALRVSSEEWKIGNQIAQGRREELVQCEEAAKQQKVVDKRRLDYYISTLRKECDTDKVERERVENSVEQFLVEALQQYSNALKYSYQHDDLRTTFKVVSLWFDNNTNVKVNKIIEQSVVHAVPSYKFVPLMYQIASRLGTGHEDFQKILQMLLGKLVDEHPHHSLTQLFALANGNKVDGDKGSAHIYKMNIDASKIQAAKDQLDTAKASDTLGELTVAMESLVNAYIDMAMMDTKEFNKSRNPIDITKVKLRTGKTFPSCLNRRATPEGSPTVLTRRFPCRADRDYSGAVRVKSFNSTFKLTDSGIHRPKILDCHGNDGQTYRQLVKGQDDMRQDLVIEQVFDTVNSMLQHASATRKRHLRLQTYKVVPLSPEAGVLEWVEKTEPLGSYLYLDPKKSAHERYHPWELKHSQCRDNMKSCERYQDKISKYEEICNEFTPVFHHFFLENFSSPAIWFQKRINYTRSVAVNSIVGHIMGIGDRHAQNILIQKETAEVVHIDFGVTFEQGQALRHPETVPFRLTRDIVDGMGVTGNAHSRPLVITIH